MRTFAQGQKPTQQIKSASPKAQNAVFAGQSHQVRSILHLQRTIGNQTVQQLPQAQSNDREVGPTCQATARFAHDFSRIPVHPKSPIKVQAKSAVPGDAYEQEADRVSDRVMRMSTPQPRECPRCQTEQPGQEHERLWTRHIGTSDLGQTAVPAIVHEVLSSPGQPLYPTALGFMEPRFGQDFSQLRVHTDAKAAESAQAIGAAAYTSGQDVVFGAGQYAPGTAEGGRLLAHELTHVVQQASAATPTLQCQPARNDLADLELELQSKMSEREMLTRMLEESQKKSAADVYERRVNTDTQKEHRLAKVKAEAQGDLGTIVDAETVRLLKNKIDVVRDKGGFTLKVRFELSYLGLTDEEGGTRAATDILRIENAIRGAWTIDLTEGRYSGNKFRLEPQIEFRPNARKRSDKALQLIVRRDAKGESFVPGLPGRSVEISFNPKHLQGEQIVIAAHELYHLFGFTDRYFIPDKKSLKGDPNAPWAKYRVGRPDAAGRGDLLGLPDLQHLREWRDKGFISQADFDRQTRTRLKVWQEDADRILYALGAPPNAEKSAAPNDPNSPGFDPQEALRTTEAKFKQQVADLESETERYAEIADSVQKMERAIQLEEQIAVLQRKIAERKAAGAKGPAKP